MYAVTAQQPQQEIRDTLDAMFAEWNREDQVKYLTHYWRSPEMRWSMKGVWYKGWQSMYDVYGAGFPPGAMGVIVYTDLEVQMLEDGLGIALYEWTHNTPSERIAGCTGQIFRKIDGAWLVIHENSARKPAGT